MKTAGKIIIRPMGPYNATTTYSILDMVTLDNKLYISKKNDLTGVTPTPSDDTNWFMLIDGKTDVDNLELALEERFTGIANDINDVQSNLNIYKTEHGTVVTKIQGDITAIQTDVTTVKKDVTAAKSAADAAQTTADQGVTDAAAAKSAADAAQTTANTAKTNAAAAKTAADNAQTTANQAKTTAETNATNLANHITAMDTELENLQDQIDGAISTHFYAYDPTNSNAPAKDWTTTEMKNIHLGDLFYNTTNSYCYRWMLQNGTYSWTRIKDSDVTKALSDAASALTKAAAAETKAAAAEAKAKALEDKMNGITFSTNFDTGNLEWNWGA